MVTLADPNCPRCGGTGHIYDDPDAIVSIRTRPCECLRRNALAASIAQRLAAARIPAKYAEASFARYNTRSTREISVPDADRSMPVRVAQAKIDADNLARVQAMAERPLRGETIVFTGPFGVGKTYLATCLLIEQVRRHGRTALSITSPEYIRTFLPGGAEPEEQRALRSLARSVDVLLLDDLGVEKGSAFAMRELYDLLNDRTNNNRATLVTSNLAIGDALQATRDVTGLPAEAREAVEIGRRIFSRLAENLVAKVAWPDGTDDHRLATARTASRRERVDFARDRFDDGGEG